MRAVIYARVSRDDTGEGRSVERQVDACQKLAALRGWTVVGTQIDNSISAWSGKTRPAWENVLRMVDAGEVDAIVAWQVDRMTRSMLDLEGLITLAESNNIIIAAASGDLDLSNESGRMTARILAAVARQEVERKASRQRLANEARAREGKPHSGGARPFGYAKDYTTVVEEEAVAIKEAASLVLADVPLAAIAQMWTRAGLYSSRTHADGSQGWTPRGVASVLSNPRLAALRVYRGEIVGAAAWPAILDEETHYALVAKLRDPSRRMGEKKVGRMPTTLLTGLALCAVCGGPIRGASSRGKLTYVCRGKFCVSAPREAVDARVGGWVVALLSQPNIISELTAGENGESERARKAAQEARRRLEELEDGYVEGVVDLATLRRLRTRLEVKITEAEATMAQGARNGALTAVVGVDDLASHWLSLPLERQRAIVGAVANVRLLPAGKSRSEPYNAVSKVLVEVS